ncbi:MAG: outer membrane beta-barrel protein [Bacteroidota bacterium]
MKKYLLLILYFASATYSLAQDQLGIKVAPSLSFSSIHTNPDTTGFSSGGVALRLKLGVIYDYDLAIKDSYYLSMGLLFAAKQASIKNNTASIKEQYELQYLQVPLLLKLYTSEVSLDTRLYVELGATGELKINDRATKLEDKPRAFRLWGLSGLIGFGVEYSTSLFTSVFAGISYQRGLTSMLEKEYDANSVSQVLGYANFVGLDVGIKF